MVRDTATTCITADPTLRLSDRFRLSLPLILLLASIGVMLVAAVQAINAGGANRRQARETLRDYTAFAAWSFRQHLRDELSEAAASVLGPVNHGNGLHESPRVPVAADLAHMLPWDAIGCWCHKAPYPPRYFYAFTLGDSHLDAVPNIFIRPYQGVVVDTMAALEKWKLEELPHVAPATAVESRWIVDTLSVAVRTAFQNEWQYGVVVGEFQGATHFFAYRPMPTLWGDTLVYAFELSNKQLARLFGGIIDQSDLLPAALTKDHTNRELMAVEIQDANGRVMYRSDSEARLTEQREDRVPHSLGGFTVRAAIRPDVVNQLLIGGMPRSPLPSLLGLLALAAVLGLVAVQQLRKATALMRMRSDFVAAVSHELRTPLSQIRLYLDTLRHGRLATDSERAWSLDNLDREATRLGNLVENVLRFASIGQERMSPRVVCDVSTAIQLTVTAFASLARSKRSSVATEIEPGIMAPLARDAFRVALHNLLDNAVKYGPPDQAITVRAYRDGDFAVIEVEDEGMGVPAGEREAIWEPFRRGSDDAAKAVGGSGIGLSIVRDVIVNHGGTATVRNGSGGGALFVLRLPGASGSRSQVPVADLVPGTGAATSP
jgi:signal transduction histidine kinase